MTKRKYPKITKEQGIINSEEVLKRLKKRKELREYEIYIGCFTNCREVGLTLYVVEKNKTFCIYEHRNSDEIIINGKDGCICLNGELPYKGDKWDHYGSVSFGEFDKATDLLVKEILKI